jgi:hypothetical protein
MPPKFDPSEVKIIYLRATGKTKKQNEKKKENKT